MAGNSCRRRKNSEKTEVKSRSTMKRNKSVARISDLNDDCLLQILYKLPLNDLLNVAQTSSRFKELAKFVFPKLCFFESRVKLLYEIYSELEANDILQNIRNLEITAFPDEKLPQLIKKISQNCTKLQKLTLSNRFVEFVDRDAIFKLIQNITSLHLIFVQLDASFIKEILLKNNGQLKELLIKKCNIRGEITFLKDLRNLKKISLEYIWTAFDPISVIEFLDNNCNSLEHLDIRIKDFLNETVISKIVSKFQNLKTICIYYHEKGTDISAIAKISTLKRVHVLFSAINSEIINTFFDDLAKTNSVESLNLLLLHCPKIIGPTRKMNSLKCLTLEQSENDWRDFRFENLPELEQLSIFSPGPNMIIHYHTMENLLLKLPKLKFLNLMTFSPLMKNQYMVLEDFLSKQNRKVIFGVDNDAFNKVMDNPDDFKFLKVQKMDYTFRDYIFQFND